MRNPNLTFIAQAITAAGGTLPDSLIDAQNKSTKIRTHIRDNRADNGGYNALAAAWAEAVVNDRDPADDREVFRALLTDAILAGDIEYAANNAIETQAAQELRDETEKILETFKEAFDRAGQTLKSAHSILGNINLDDTTTIFNLGATAVQAHQEANDARRLTRIIDTGWAALATLTGFAPDNDRAVRWADVPLEVWEQHRQVKDTWHLITAGCTLDLAIDRDTINARDERIARERNTRDNAHTTSDRAQRRAWGADVLTNIAAAQKAHADN